MEEKELEKRLEKTNTLSNICTRYMSESLVAQFYFREATKRFLNNEEFSKLEKSIIKCDEILYELAQYYYNNREMFIKEGLGIPEEETVEQRIEAALKGGYETSKNFQEIKKIRIELKEIA